MKPDRGPQEHGLPPHTPHGAQFLHLHEQDCGASLASSVPSEGLLQSDQNHELPSLDWFNFASLNQPMYSYHTHNLALQGQQHQQQTQLPFAMRNGIPPQHSTASPQPTCVSAASCPLVLSPAASSECWRLQKFADVGRVPEIPDVEQCMPVQSDLSQSGRHVFQGPVPIDFTIETVPVPSVPQTSQASNRKMSTTSAGPSRQDDTSKPSESRKRRSSALPAAKVIAKSSATASIKPARTTKVAHSVVEQRYRDNLNGKIAQLHKTLSTTKGSGSSSSDGGEGEAMLPRTRKADILASAIDYIKRAEKSRDDLEKEVDFLRMRITTLEKLASCEGCRIITELEHMRLSVGLPV